MLPIEPPPPRDDLVLHHRHMRRRPAEGGESQAQEQQRDLAQPMPRARPGSRGRRVVSGKGAGDTQTSDECRERTQRDAGRGAAPWET